ncbi:MAG: hypothetical protein H7251_16990 [Acetobacteraceae bacterium]|nr:hypothetical protein [Acetobacteraceae bacterium]
MIRMTIASLAVAVLFAAGPVSAQTSTMTCKDAMAKNDMAMSSMTDATKRAAAMKQVDMAKDMMAKNDEAGCMMHMNNAMGMGATK